MSILKRILGVFRRNGVMAPPNSGASAGGSPEMITCEEALSRVHEYLDGELDGVSAEEVRLHFDVCQRCYPHLRLEEAFQAALRRAADADTPIPPDLRDRVLDMLAEVGEE